MTRILKIILIVVVFATFGWFLYQTDFEATWLALQQMGTRILWVLLSTIIAYLLGTWGWRYCLGPEARSISLLRLFVYRHIGETVGLFNPTSVIAGDLLKASYLEKHHIQQAEALTSVVLSRILMIVSQLFLMALTLCAMLFSNSAPISDALHQILIGVLVLLVGVLILIPWFVMKKQKEVTKTAQKPGFWQKVNIKLSEMRALLAAFIRSNPKSAVLGLLLFALHWIVGSLELYFIMHAIGYPIRVWDGLFMDMGIIVVKSLGAFVPGQIGIEELGNKMVLGLIGIGSLSVWLSVSVLRRSRQLFWSFMGFVFYLIFNRSAKS